MNAETLRQLEDYERLKLIRELPILFQDDHYVAVDKPSGIFVHPSALSPREKITCLSIVRDQIQKWLYPVHRLDRATSGVLIFGLSSEAASRLQDLLKADDSGHRVQKKYSAVVRGWPQEAFEVNLPLKEDEESEPVPALTRFKKVREIEFPEPVGKRYATARYAWVEAEPLTGRFHQIRKHLASASYPIIGDRVHGDSKHNVYFRDRHGCARLLLHATHLSFEHPFTKNRVSISSVLPSEFTRIFEERVTSESNA
jgi:tRNA pseudouridine65 synthase